MKTSENVNSPARKSGAVCKVGENYESYGNVLHLHAGAGLAFDALGCLFEQRDERDAAGL